MESTHHPMRRGLTAISLAAGVLAGGCNGGKDTCTAGVDTSCPADKVCEQVTTGSSVKAQCFGPTNVNGRVSDATTGGPIPGARVVLWNVDSLKAVGAAQIANTSGNFVVPETLPRVTGMMSRQRYAIRISAPGYLDYPGGVRTSEDIVLTLATATAEGDAHVIRASSLAPVDKAPPGGITGKVTGGPGGAAVLVVAEAGGKGYSGISDATGTYVIYNVPDGTYEVRGYLKDTSYGPASATVAGGVAGVDLAAQAASGSGSGKASFSDTATPCEQTVGVVVAVKSTGEAVPGVHGTVDLKSGSYEVKDVPAGSLTVEVSQENDCLIRDPSSPEAGGIDHAFAAGEAFDATSRVVPLIKALDMRGPGRDSEEIFGVDTLKWEAFPDADEYLIEVFDVFGAPLAPGGTTTVAAKDVSADGGTLSIDQYIKSGLHYQWRATARKGGKVLTRTEERRGQFWKK